MESQRRTQARSARELPFGQSGCVQKQLRNASDWENRSGNLLFTPCSQGWALQNKHCRIWACRASLPSQRRRKPMLVVSVARMAWLQAVTTSRMLGLWLRRAGANAASTMMSVLFLPIRQTCWWQGFHVPRTVSSVVALGRKRRCVRIQNSRR